MRHKERNRGKRLVSERASERHGERYKHGDRKT